MAKRKSRAGAPAPAVGPNEADIDERAAAIAGGVLASFGEMNFDDLKTIEEHTGEDPNTSAVWECFHFIARFLIRDHSQFGPDRGKIVERALGLEPTATMGSKGVAEAETKLRKMSHAAVLALCLRLCAECELLAAPRSPFGTNFLEWAELDWEQLREQARSELTGGETADQKLARAEATQKAQGTLFDTEDI